MMPACPVPDMLFLTRAILKRLMFWKLVSDVCVCIAFCLCTEWFSGLDLRKDEKSFERSIYRQQNLLALRWPSVVDRMLKSNYWHSTQWTFLIRSCPCIQGGIQIVTSTHTHTYTQRHQQICMPTQLQVFMNFYFWHHVKLLTSQCMFWVHHTTMPQ